MFGKRKTRSIKPCLYCGGPIEYIKGTVEGEKKKYCSNKCRLKALHLSKKGIERNHKVMSIHRIGGKLDVYDLTVEKYHNFALSSGVFVHNTGKTRIAVYSIGYILYKILCLKDPWKYHNRAAGGKMSVAFFNLTKTLSESRAYDILQQHLLSSEWFREKGFVVGKEPNQRLEFPLFDFCLSSPLSAGFGTQGRDVICAIMDEVDTPTVSEKQKQRVLSAYESTVRRFESRFVDEVYKEAIGKFFLVASKQEKDSFLDTFVAERKNSKNTYVADIKYWETKEKGTYSGKTIPVLLGDVYMSPKILTSKRDVEEAIKSGYQVMDVPIEFQDAFERDVVGALRDIAGVSTVGLRRSKLFPSERSLYDCYDETKPDPANMSTSVIGLQDEVDLIRFLDLKKIRVPKHFPRFVHCDIAYSGDGDCLSLAMSCVKEWIKKDYELADGTFETRNVPVIETDFVMRIKGKPGDEIPLYRVRKLILDLRAAGYTINYTSDLALLSADTKQILTKAGIPCDYLSLDKTVEPYLTFRELVYEQRWVCHKIPMLHFELANLEYDKDKQKIDHPDKVQTMELLEQGGVREAVVKGSKDMSDSVAGSVFRAVESAPSVPVEVETVKSIANIIKGPTAKKEYDWVLDSPTIKGGFEQYLLLDDKGQFWIWTKENEMVSPSLKGPFQEKLVNLPVIQIKNPAQFNPKKKDSVQVDSNKMKLDILKIARGG
jgi:hypothetical protein